MLMIIFPLVNTEITINTKLTLLTTSALCITLHVVFLDARQYRYNDH